MRAYFTNVLMIALSVAFLAHFTLIVKYGGYFIQEPNIAILLSEIAMFFVIIGFGVSNLIIKLKEGKNGLSGMD